MTSPEKAYANTPPLVDEFRSITRLNAAGREFWLRKAALADRLALDEEGEYGPSHAASALRAAEAAAVHLIAYDELHGTGREFDGGDGCGQGGNRAYVRREYLTWSRSENS